MPKIPIVLHWKGRTRTINSETVLIYSHGYCNIFSSTRRTATRPEKVPNVVLILFFFFLQDSELSAKCITKPRVDFFSAITFSLRTVLVVYWKIAQRLWHAHVEIRRFVRRHTDTGFLNVHISSRGLISDYCFLGSIGKKKKKTKKNCSVVWADGKPCSIRNNGLFRLRKLIVGFSTF